MQKNFPALPGRRRWRLAGVAGAVAAVLMIGVPVVMAEQNSGGADPGTRVIGGHDASEEYSFMTAVMKDGEFGCGGSLIGAKWVVTAAHCAPKDGPTEVRVGSNDRTTGGEKAKIAQAVVHPDYQEGKPGNDIALLRLDHEVGRTPVGIADAPGKTDTQTRTLGWGSTCEPAPDEECRELPKTLQELDAKLLDDSKCHDYDASGELCNGGRANAQACFGDSGGPLLIFGKGGWKLVGVTSRDGTSFDDETCADGPGIWTDVTSHRNWINRTIG